MSDPFKKRLQYEDAQRKVQCIPIDDGVNVYLTNKHEVPARELRFFLSETAARELHRILASAVKLIGKERLWMQVEP